MNIDNDLIHRLVLEELAGVISDEDQAYLKKTIRENPEAFNIWMETRSILDTPDVKAFLESPRPVEDIFHASLKKRNGFGHWGFSLSMAAILIAGFCIFRLYYPPKAAVQIAIAKTELVNNKNIKLDLPGEGTVDLSQQQGNVKLNAISLNNTQNSLTYDAGKNNSYKLATLTIPVGKDYKITLGDGSNVWLNSTTKMQFPLNFTDHSRDIYIDGEAYIEVAKDTKPFVVHLPGSTVQVLGTAFNVNSYDKGNIQVALVSGSVKVNANNDTVQLKPGDELTLKFSALNITPFDEQNLLSWRQGIYFFNNSPVSQIIKVLTRWFSNEIVIDNPDRNNIRFTGMINRNEPIDNSLDLLKSTNEFDYYKKGDTIHIK
ncbi:DUF4974 domain-containing protein [Chitinophaga sancti]|uniref:FecR family protein n=1 Tax=Chitinophaga sancti TaxID=1004 RepID=UPI002A758E85|nr:FecR domain-containing protein [Chitinophaga sancti]WPQ63373.1 DUF4974 domain-containing protein [Chitinophaga sancti]